jgi:hypothetical protein
MNTVARSPANLLNGSEVLLWRDIRPTQELASP